MSLEKIPFWNYARFHVRFSWTVCIESTVYTTIFMFATTTAYPVKSHKRGLGSVERTQTLWLPHGGREAV